MSLYQDIWKKMCYKTKKNNECELFSHFSHAKGNKEITSELREYHLPNIYMDTCGYIYVWIYICEYVCIIEIAIKHTMVHKKHFKPQFCRFNSLHVQRIS